MTRSKLSANLAKLPTGTIPEVVFHFMKNFWFDGILSGGVAHVSVHEMLLDIFLLDQEELATNKEKTNRHLRLAELLQEHSSAAELIVMYA